MKILAKGVKSGVSIKGAEAKVYEVMNCLTEQFLIMDEYGGIYIYDGMETHVVEEPFELRCNVDLKNNECVSAFNKIYEEVKTKEA